MKIFFNGWFSGFLDKTNPGIHVEFFLELFKLIYSEECIIGTVDDSDILCEFDMMLDCVGTYLQYKKWKYTYLFNGESTMKCDTKNYDVVLWGERNYNNIVNIPLFIPYIYCNNFIHRINEKKKVVEVPKNDVCVMISNPLGDVRNAFLNELEKNFNVTYAGGYKNNIGGNILYPYNSSEFLEYVSKFKFIISMENSRNDTYITEKIVHGLLANSIPVYWGSTRVFDYFNEDRILYLEDYENIENTINYMKYIKNNPRRWLEIVNNCNLKNDSLNRTIDNIAKDIRCLINKGGWNHISKIYCINNPCFEPDRNNLLKNMFIKQNVSDDYVKYISPTYKTTIAEDTYNKFTKNQLVRHLRFESLKYSELSLFLNYRAALEDIERNYKDGMFLIFESDVLESKDISNLNRFLDFINNKNFDLIHIGKECEKLFKVPLAYDFETGYRLKGQSLNNDIIEYYNENKKSDVYIEDITTQQDEFRVVRRFDTKCTDSFLWKYSGIIKFLNFMISFEDYSCPFDYYMCNFFEKNINFKHYWSCNEFFIQGSNEGIIKSTIK